MRFIGIHILRQFSVILVLFGIASVCLAQTNRPPVINGECGSTLTVIPGGIATTMITAYDLDPGDSVANISISVSPDPDGDYTFNNQILAFYPSEADKDKEFGFVIRAYDTHDSSGVCFITIRCERYWETEPFEIMIEFEDGLEGDAPLGDGVYTGQHADVDVTYNLGSEEMHAFDILIGYNDKLISFMGAFANRELYDIPGNYEWEYFTYRFVDNCGDSCPSGLLEVIGIADQNNGAHHPVLDTNTGRIKILPERTLHFTMDFLI